MIHHQHVYLCDSFAAMPRGFEGGRNQGLAIKHWYRLLDLSQIKWPVLGVLDNNGNLNTNVRSYDHIHLVGTPEEEYSTVSSRLLVEYEDSEDDYLTDAELFRETQEANLIRHILLDYCKLHPYANDGISIGVYCRTYTAHYYWDRCVLD